MNPKLEVYSAFEILRDRQAGRIPLELNRDHR